MTKKKAKPFNWFNPYSGNRYSRYRPPDFEKYSNGIDKNIIFLFRKLHEYLILSVQKKESFNNSYYSYNHLNRSLLLEDPKCGPSIEFYFHFYVPFLHACAYNVNANTYREYRSSRKHFLLTITKDFLKIYNTYNYMPETFDLGPTHSDGRRIYQLQLNYNSLTCKRSNCEFLSINQFCDYVFNNDNMQNLKLILEKIVFTTI